MKQRIRHLIYIIVLVVLDQLSKLWVRTVLAEKGPVIIIPDVLKLQYHENAGAVWGILQGKVSFLKIFTFILILGIAYLYFKIPNTKKFQILKIIFVFITAGAIGNLIDRIFLNHVVDFIYFELINFPVFNLADSCITISSILLLVLAIFYYKDDDFSFLDQLFKKKKKKDNDSSEE